MSPVLMQDQHMNSFIGSRRDHESPQHDKESPRQSSYRRLFPNRYGPLIPPKRSFPPASMATSVSCNDIPYHNNRMETLLRPQHAEFREKPVSLLPALLNEQGHIPEKGTFCAGATREPPENLPPQSPQALETERQSDRSEDVGHGQKGNVRRCLSSKELRTENPLSGSPYSYMLYQKEQISARMTQRLKETLANPPPRVFSDDSSGSSLGGPLNNKARNQRRAEHNRAITNELCEIVTDLFVAESKLINPSSYGVDSAQKREQVMRSVERFVGSLPPRYALSAETPSEVLLHMRLAAAVRANPTRAVVHITNIENGSHWAKSSEAGHNIKLVTIACSDANGLLEYMTKTLASDGSRVLDADVMLSSDSIVLDRFIVEMQGRLRLDKLSKCIEYFLQQTKRRSDSSASEVPPEERSDSVSSDASRCHSENSGAVYFRPSPSRKDVEIQEEIKTAVPLSEIVAIGSSSAGLSSLHLTSTCLPLSRHLSIPRSLQAPAAYSPGKPGTVKTKASEDGSNVGDNNPDETIPKNIVTTDPDVALNEEIRIKEISDDRLVIEPRSPPQMRYNINFDFEMNKAVYSSPRENQKRQLVKRSGNSDFDAIGNREISGDMLAYDHAISNALYRTIPMIPFDELMLIETLGMGRVSTIYRAAWRQKMTGDQYPDAVNSQMLALKVAIVNSGSYDTSHVDELRREADIAARLKHPNICDLKGVAADSDCFCLAYEFCEGGSLLSLLADKTRYYEYLPIALDIANGMAYLHSRDVIHRDLKPSNVLLTRDHRAKISDFGMSVANAGQELTAETGTYRYMAPEVIRHESYSSNADVYSFGVCLWQLITREVPFATMSPVQAAYSVAEGRRPPIPESTPRRLKEIVTACWDQDAGRRPSFTYIAMALADYAKMAFSPANVGANTLNIANEMLANVEGNSTVNVDFTTPVIKGGYLDQVDFSTHGSDVGLEI